MGDSVRITGLGSVEGAALEYRTGSNVHTNDVSDTERAREIAGYGVLDGDGCASFILGNILDWKLWLGAAIGFILVLAWCAFEIVM